MKRSRCVAFGCLALCSLAGGNAYAQSSDDIEFSRLDPDNPGGQRLGQDDDEDGFTGYPADPGEPSDPYFDTTAEHRLFSPNWTGAFVGLGASTGITQLRGGYLDSPSWAPSFGAFVNGGTVGALADFQLAWRYADHNTTIETTEVDVARNSLAASIGVHPGFFYLIGGTRSDYTVADLSFFLGPSLERQNIRGEFVNSRYTSLGYHFGARISTFLDSPQDGGAAWIGLEYRYNSISGSDSDPLLRRQRLHEHIIGLRIEWRINGLVVDSELLAR